MSYRYLLLLCVFLLSACSSSASAPSPTATVAPRKNNRPVSRPAPPVRTAYAALGASETYGVGAQPHTRGYAYLVARALHARPFLDLGIPGTTLAAGYQQELTSALAIRPHLCTAFFGFNDVRAGVTRAAFLQDLNDLVATLRQAKCEVLVIDLPDISILPAVRQSGIGGIHETVLSWNAGMRAVAARNGAHFLDLASYSAELAHHPEYVSEDGLHPSNKGHARLAKVVIDAMRRFGMVAR